MGLWSPERGQVNQHQHKFAGKVFVQNYLNHVSAVVIPALGINPSLRLRFVLWNAGLLALHVCAITHFTD